jgi:alkylation response protein AidB-like acyl-CoA dehydrogenase
VDLDLDATQSLLRDSFREFLEREVPFDRVRECEHKGVADAELWSRLVGLGWLGAGFKDSLGGGDGGLVEAGLLVEEVERRAALVPVAEALACARTALRHGGAAGEELARAVISGDAIPVPALLESADVFDAGDASVDGDRLRGEKYFVDYAAFATHHLVAATGDRGRGLYLVARDATVACQPTPGIGRIPRAIARYDDSPCRRICGAEGLAELVRVARALAAVQIVACMQRSLEMTVAYTSVREQFGRPLGTFQAVQHHAADMAIHVESTRFLVYEALDALERDTASDVQVAIAKAAASQSAPEVVMLGHQLHGGHGFIEENDLYFFTLRARDRALAWGSAEECLAIVAEDVDRQRDWL